MIILVAMSRYERDVPLTLLAEDVGFPKSTLVRLLQSMRCYGVVQQDPRTRRYRLGTGLIHLGKAAERQFDLERLIGPCLAELTRSTGETASLAVLEGDRAIYLVQVPSDSIIRGVPPIGAQLNLHCTAVGKVLLTSMSAERIDSVIRKQGLPWHTENTLVDADSLRAELERIRRDGYAVDDEEAEPGGRCIAAPVRDDRGEIIAAVSITGPSTRMKSDRIGPLAAIVMRVAANVTAALRDQNVRFE